MFTAKMKRYLMLLAALGLVAIAAGGGSGTFASFNAEVSNNGNYFQTGTLFLHDTAGGTTCSSESATNNQNNGTGDNCGTVFGVGPTDPGWNAETSYGVDLTNAGSLASGNVQFFGACTSGAGAYVSSGLTFDSTGQGSSVSTIATHGSSTYGLPVGTLVRIGSATSGTIFTTTTSAIGVNTSTPTINISSGDTSSYSDGDPIYVAVQFSGGQTLCSQLKVEIGTVSATNEDYTDGSYVCKWGCAGDKHLSDLNGLPTTGTLTALAGTNLAANGVDHLIVTITPPDLSSSTDNSYQNQKASVNITWHVDQA